MTYAVTPCRLDEHREALERLWADNMSDQRIAEVLADRLRWLYAQGPEGPPTTMLCVVQETGEVVGCGSFVRRPLWVGGRRVMGGLLCDFAVARSHRVVGAALAIQRALLEAAPAAGAEVLYGYPNERSQAIFKRLGYQAVGQTSTWVKPLRTARLLRGALRWGWAAALAAGPIDLALALRDGVHRRLSARRLQGMVPVEPGDPTDDLWARARDAFGVTGERTAAFLRWRYGGFKTAEYRMVGLRAGPGPRLAGLAVYKVEGARAYLHDLLVDRGLATESALLLALAAHLRREGADAVSLVHLGDPVVEAELQRAGFLRRPGARSLVLHAAGLAEPLRAQLLQPHRWHMLDGELDL